ncbi:MAG: CopG family transcriptional regulator [Elusimicrobia bacterium]|nr:CopG family transcriptional regulator [Elusimicrobiota bacterium]
MKRTQIYLSMEQWKTLHALSFRTHQSISNLIRAAIDRKYLGGRHPDFESGIRAAFGIWKDRKDIGSAAAYIRALRKDTRMERLRRLKKEPHERHNP